jgi:PPOX class probable F420-dependent enzyme
MTTDVVVPELGPVVPSTHADLLEAPLFGHLCTIRPDGSPQSNVMWFAWNGSVLRFSHRSNRQKFHNLQHEPRVSISIQDPTQPYRFLEVRGLVESITPDHAAAFYVELQRRYGVSFPSYDEDANARVVITVRPTKFVPVDNGMTPTEMAHLIALLESLPPDAEPAD